MSGCFPFVSDGVSNLERLDGGVEEEAGMLRETANFRRTQ
jgi:hypothetical protein